MQITLHVVELGSAKASNKPESKTKQVNSEMFNLNSLLTNWGEYGFCPEGWCTFSPVAPVAETSQKRRGCQDLSFTLKPIRKSPIESTVPSTY